MKNEESIKILTEKLEKLTGKKVVLEEKVDYPTYSQDVDKSATSIANIIKTSIKKKAPFLARKHEIPAGDVEALLTSKIKSKL